MYCSSGSSDRAVDRNGTFVTGNVSTFTSGDAPGLTQDRRYLFVPSDDCAEDDEEGAEEEGGTLLADLHCVSHAPFV